MAKFINLVTKGFLKLPKFIIIYGVEEIGKTTFGAKFPDPIFTGPETSALFDVARMPRPGSWSEYLEQLHDLRDPAYPYKTLVIDSLDWLEHLLFEHLKKQYKVNEVEESGGGFGKWVGVAQKNWLDFLKLIDALKHEKKMDIVAIAHFQIKVFNDPLTSLPYDRYQMKLNDKCAALLREAADCVLFANFQTSSFSKDAKAKKGRGISDGARVVYTEKRASHDAKNRFSLPYELPFDYNVIMQHLDASKEDQLKELQRDVEALLLDVKDADKLPAMKTFYEENKNDIETLKLTKNRLKMIVGEINYAAE